MAKNSQKWPIFLLLFGQFWIAIFDLLPVSTTPSVYTQNDQRQKLYKKGSDDIFRYPKVRGRSWPSTENRPFFPKIPDFWPKIENFYDTPIMVEKISGRSCEPIDRSSDQLVVSIGQYWDD